MGSVFGLVRTCIFGILEVVGFGGSFDAVIRERSEWSGVIRLSKHGHECSNE